ncbi:hypothetical protein SAMN05421504_105461 [Amycolatopsis xylanica]|uniref:Peptidase inhibitor family I36 n=1 Tax=Amycolatopsis xylanica TaxID=589385 RepID=A0A1H3JMB9_9PSEU|nr:hypothetical protein SAMN05421504_105461 [Amycolatopsis xylanica]
MFALTLTGLSMTGIAFAAPASASLAGEDPYCKAGYICLYSGESFNSGQRWDYDPNSGYQDLPDYLHDNVNSFKSRAKGCFIAYTDNGKETRVVNDGDYQSVYGRGRFGSIMDAVAGSC